VPPEHVFNAGLGELFVVRMAGHTCDPETLASIEHAVEHLNVPLCVVLAHEDCGAVAATVQQVTAPAPKANHGESSSLRRLLEQIEPAVRRARSRDLEGKALCTASEEENAHHVVNECLRRSDLLRRYSTVGRFRMVPARYHLQDGSVEWLPVRPLPLETTAGREFPPGSVPVGVPPHVALRLLQAGHRRYLGDGQPAGDVSAKRREELTHGQQPLAIVLTCSDSRVSPEHVFDAGLGELFVVRVAGNTLNDDALASIEYAAAHTGASLLLVMGHTRCDAVRAAAESPESTEMSTHMRALLTRLEPSVAMARGKATGPELVDLAARTNTLRTVAEARSRSPLLRQLETEGRFAMLPVVYDLATGDLTWPKDAVAPEAAASAAPAGETRPPRHGTDAHAAAKPQALEPPVQTAHAGDTAATAQEEQGEHAPVGTDAASWETADGRSARWLNKRILVGIAGVLSLSMAAVLVLRRR
jgi:carbonic anhydrase